VRNVARIHNRRAGWTINVSQNVIDTSMMYGGSIFLSGLTEVTLDLDVYDAIVAQELLSLAEAAYQRRGCPTAEAIGGVGRAVWYRVHGIVITLDEANMIRNGTHPLEILRPTGNIHAVPIDMKEFL
jgi:hypothetical protein